MNYKITNFALTLIFSIVLQFAPALSQQQSDPLAFSPTGDALWDTYAQALLEQLPDMINKPREGIVAISAPSGVGVLPDDLLASWQPEFGNDPRYWQLRYFNKAAFDTYQDFLHGGPIHPEEYEYIEPAPAEYLLQGKELGVADWVTEILLYDAQDRELEWLQENYNDISDEEKAINSVPEIVTEPFVALWFEDQRLPRLNYLASTLPDESWPYYERAMYQFEHGNWDAALISLRRGNEAKKPTASGISNFVYH